MPHWTYSPSDDVQVRNVSDSLHLEKLEKMKCPCFLLLKVIYKRYNMVAATKSCTDIFNAQHFAPYLQNNVF